MGQGEYQSHNTHNATINISKLHLAINTTINSSNNKYASANDRQGSLLYIQVQSANMICMLTFQRYILLAFYFLTKTKLLSQTNHFVLIMIYII